MLSVFIPSFNHAAYVTQAIDSARRINVPGTHIYVIDDASTDDSVAVIRDHLAQERASNVTLVTKERNKGVIDSMLTFMDRCQTEFIYVVSSDDIAVAEGVEELVHHLNDHPKMGFIIGGGYNLLADGSSVPVYSKRHQKLFRYSGNRFITRLFLMDASPLLCQSSVFRLQALVETNAVTRGLVADDYAIFSKLFQKFMRRGVDFEFYPDVDVVNYRHHQTNSYRNLLRQVETSIQVLKAVAPPALRQRAIGYKLAFYFLVAVRRRDRSAARDITRMVGWHRASDFAAGLVAHAYWWMRFQ
ncbi:glycosyltransferase family 2 protein [Sphingomonas sp. KR1UV-12]|uniref:Glycosyltransferase family 2 protein n=1 Tax=Sphingomonas aurea TaxID=3063994 RepID=A0ABT9EPD1_9SPHN|nr:glycosyltransferase family 2 protein [Sphingomonas sp. KR1UV-12]MDP1028817.1 glycosyltransferase family 2 protein [Sphingomonas sp. KR1UV-12]